MTRAFTGDELVIATHNRGKLDEIAAVMGGRIKKFYTSSDFGLEAPAETGTTFLENAAIKALYTAQKTGKPALADDSGLCVDALDGAPGVYTADWAERPDGKRDFIYAMKTVHEKIGANPNRRGQFVSCLVLAWPDGHTESVEVRVQGTLVWPMRGHGGHGFDPMFQPEGYDSTYAEMTMEDKNAISHRGQSLREMIKKCF